MSRWAKCLFGAGSTLLAVGIAGVSEAQAPLATGGQLRAAAAAAGVDMASRDANGHLIIRARPLPERIIVDGRLDESVYSQFQPAGDFVQVEPNYGEPATEQTQLWVFFDDKALYIGIRCYDSGTDQWSSLDLRRDSSGFSQAESVSVALDPFFDRRNGYTFGVNPAGGISDSAITNERDSNRDWNTIWDTRTARFDGGWAVEMAIPFKSLRYAPGEQVWGINVRRSVRWKNEMSYLNQVPLSGQFSAMMGLFRFSSAATLTGLTMPGESRLVEIKPYGISSMKTNLGADEPFTNRATGSLGVDAKVGVTRGLVADFTYNTDFAQVEDDEQQVNLTRFSLFFPEKREFFLEGQGIFAFGGFTQRRSGNPGEIPMPFFSRRIGIDDDGNAVPILGGGRLTGRAGKYTVGIVNIQTKEDRASKEPSTTFSVVRLRRDILRRSNIGLIMVNRSAYGTRLSSNQAYGVDGIFSFYQNLNINTYLARTHTPGRTGDASSYRVQMEYNADRYGVTLENMGVGRNFNPEVGYVRRKDIRRTLADLRFSPRPRSAQVIRKYDFSGSVDQFTRLSDGVLESRAVEGSFGIEFQSSDQVSIQVLDITEQLNRAYQVVNGIFIPVGNYHFKNMVARYDLGSHHAFSGNVSYEYGGFFGGSKHTVAISRSRAEPFGNFFVEPGVSLNWIDIPQGRFAAKVLTGRFIYMFSPRTFVSALAQYNSDSHSMAINARMRWEYKPGSDLFIVYSDGRDTSSRGFPALENRALTVKLTRFVRL